MIPLLVEYSENDDTGCGLGAVVLVVLTIGTVLLVRLATGRART